jgi:FKBP-type peptidyl-prolyl cis-trans isomerase FkpA
MKIYFLFLAVFTLAACTKTKLSSDLEKQSYATGVRFAETYKKNKIQLDLNLVKKGMDDTFAGRKLLLDQQELQKSQMDLMYRVQTEQKKSADINSQDARKKMDEFLRQPGVKKTATGLLYKISKMGTGEKAQSVDTVVVDYTGRLLNGLIFDSSKMHGRDGQFFLKNVFPGLRESLMLVPAGSQFQVLIPPELAYGASGNATIPPNSPLLFDLEIKSIKK